ncbi:MAG TPA: PPE domain-containing protein [Pseudonocardiaceae bacterium]|nr:PPE domain-containing protein [Pseudonocardiaceae bacterium]
MVRIGGGRAITGSTNWAAMSHEQLYAAVCEQNDPSVVYGVSDKWISLGNNMLDSANSLHKQVAASSSGWQGEAAESSRNAVTQLVDWGGKASQTAQFMGHQLNQQGQVMAAAKVNMPQPTEFNLTVAAAADPGMAGFTDSLIDTQPFQQMAQESHARAIDVATAMEQGSTQIDAATPEFEPVPMVTSAKPTIPASPRLVSPSGEPGLQSSAPEPLLPFQQGITPATATTGTGTQQLTPVVPGQTQPGTPGSTGTTPSGYQPPAPAPGYQPGVTPPVGNQPHGGPSYQPVNPGSGPNPGGSSGPVDCPTPPDVYTVPSNTTTTSGFPYTGPGPGMPSNGNPQWPGGTGPTPSPVGEQPPGTSGGPFPFGGGPSQSGPFTGGVGGFGGTGTGTAGSAAGEESVRAYQPGAISSRLGSGSTGSGGSSSSASGAAAAAAESEGTGTGALGSAAQQTPAASGMSGGSGSKRKEDDKEHKSAGYVQGEDIFEPLGGELPPPVIGERRPKSSK